MQANVRVCKEINIEKMMPNWNNFMVKDAGLKDHNYKKSGKMYQNDILKDDSS